MSSQEKYYPSTWDAVLVWVVIACKVFVLISGSDVKPKLRMNGGNISMLLKLDYLSLYPEMTKLVSSWQHVHYLVIRVQKCHTSRVWTTAETQKLSSLGGLCYFSMHICFSASFLSSSSLILCKIRILLIYDSCMSLIHH